MLDDNDKVLQASEARARKFLTNQHPGAVRRQSKIDEEDSATPSKRRRLDEDEDIKAEDLPVYKKLPDTDKPIT